MVLSADDLRTRVQARLAEQRQLVVELLELRDQVGGSLFARYGTCGKPTCACASGQRHGPYYVLSTRSAGQGSFAYLEPRAVPAARRMVQSHRAFRRGLARLKRKNAELVELLQRYQRSQVKTNARRLRPTTVQA